MNRIQIFNSLCINGKTVGCVFTKTNYAQGHEKVYTYRVPDNMGVKKNDLAVVEKEGIYSFVTIVEVHEQSQIDSLANFRYKWILAIIDIEPYFKTMAEEDLVLKEITNQEIPLDLRE